MGNSYTQQVKLTGMWSTKANPEKELSVFVEGMLQRAGTEIVALMRAETKPFDFNGTLTKSIAWRTAIRSSAVPEPKYLIAAPNVNNAVDIGSAAPHAYYREYGAGPHRTADGSALFLESMRDWVHKVIGISTSQNASAEEKAHFWAIVNKIRNGPKAKMHQQGLQPFVKPVEPKIPVLAARIAADAVTQYWDHIAKKYEV